MTDTIVPPTLREMEAYLSHIAVSGTTNSPSSSKGVGGGKFDEGKVKRDKGGKFSKQAYKKEAKALNDKFLKKYEEKFGLSRQEAKTLDVDDYIKKLPKDQAKEFEKIFEQQWEEGVRLLKKHNHPVLDWKVSEEERKEFEHSDLDDDFFLAHFGVKGMKWGVSRSDGGGGSRAQLASAARVAGKAARIAAPIALPAAAAGIASLGLALPAVPIAAGAASMAMKALNEPAVQEAIKTAGAWSKSVANEFGSVKLSDLPKPNLPNFRTSPSEFRRESAGARVTAESNLSRMLTPTTRFVTGTRANYGGGGSVE